MNLDHIVFVARSSGIVIGVPVSSKRASRKVKRSIIINNGLISRQCGVNIKCADLPRLQDNVLIQFQPNVFCLRRSVGFLVDLGPVSLGQSKGTGSVVPVSSVVIVIINHISILGDPNCQGSQLSSHCHAADGDVVYWK